MPKLLDFEAQIFGELAHFLFSFQGSEKLAFTVRKTTETLGSKPVVYSGCIQWF
ncbi:MAG: hypothetical protein V7L29_22140 [Nostoc sp.]|uniref:hypothetical protein n=1 Tax=Nostoc sp. TaxID=1180 RepID=UPI002FF51966